MAKTGLGRGLSSLLGARSPADKKTKSGKKPASTPTPAIAKTPNEVPVGEILPGAMQPRNGIDDDCDDAVDEDEALDAATWYADSDGDDYGYANHNRRRRRHYRWWYD